MRMLVIFFATLLMCGLPIDGSAAVIHVPGDQPTIQAGIDAAVNGDTVLVAAGIWTGPGNYNLNFEGKSITVASEDGPEACIIDCEELSRGFHFHSEEGLKAVVRGFTIRNGIATGRSDAGGGGILIEGAAPLISGCIFIDNNGGWYGGGCSVTSDSGGLIADCVFRDNWAVYGGGLALGGDAEARNCLVMQNDANELGGGLYTRADGNVLVQGCTITENYSIDGGGGIGAWYSNLTMDNCIIWGNDADLEYPLPSDEGLLWGDTVFSYSYNCSGESWYVDYDVILDSGPGNIGDDPLFAVGPEGDWYLSQIAAGQPADSPCVDTGDPESGPNGTTRTDLEPDNGVRDMGYHSLISPGMYICHDPFSFTYFLDLGDPPPAARALEIWSCSQGTIDWSVSCEADWLTLDPPTGSSSGETDVVTFSADTSLLAAGTERTEIVISAPGALNSPVTIPVRVHIDGPRAHYGLVAGPGPSPDNPPLVRVFRTGEPPTLFNEFFAYGATGYGVRVACGDPDGDGAEEIITGAGPGAIYGPHVRGWNIDGSPLPGLNFIAYGTLKYGVNVACGDLDGDRYDEIITGAGPGAVFGPHVRAFHYDHRAETVSPLGGVNFFAYGTLKYGVNVSCGDLDGDGMDEIVTGAGPGAVFGPHVRGWNVDGGTAAPLPGVSFMAYNSNHYGVNVACGDIDDDGLAEIVTAPGPGPSLGALVRGWDFDGDQVTPVPGCEIFAWPPEQRLYGARVALQRASSSSVLNYDFIIVGGGPDPGADSEVLVYVYRADAQQLELHRNFEAFENGLTWGVDAAGGGMEF